MLLLEGFENFSVSSWYDRVLTKHVKVVKASVAKKADKWAGAVAATSILVALATPAGASAQPLPIVTPISSNHATHDSRYGQLVQPEYWSKLMVKMKDTEKLPEVDFPDED